MKGARIHGGALYCATCGAQQVPFNEFCSCNVALAWAQIGSALGYLAYKLGEV